MTNEAQRIAIAKSCGWIVMADGRAFNKTSMLDDDNCVCSSIPDYLNDLNAMHEAEKVLNEKQAVWYLQKLTQVRYKAGVSGTICCMIDKTVFATASQRAEAFLRTISKWKD